MQPDHSRANTAPDPRTVLAPLYPAALTPMGAPSEDGDSPPKKSGPGMLALLPFDPLRLVDAIWRKLGLALLVGGALGAALYVAAAIKVEPHFVGQITLLRQEPPTGLRATESGEAFKPGQITIATLISLMKSPVVNEATSAAINGVLTPAEVAASVQIAAERGTDIIRVTMSTARGAEITASALNAYATEAVKITRTMMVNDATAMNRFMLEQLALVDKEIAAVDEELLRYTRENKIIDTDKEISAALGSLSNQDARLQEIQMEYESLDLRISSTQKELAKASPLAAKLNSAREEHQRLLSRYTAEHPTVREQDERIKMLETQLHETLGGKEDRPPQSGDGAVAENLYLGLITLRSQKSVLAQQMEKMKSTRAALEARLNELPRKSVEVAQIKVKRQALEKAQSVLASRERETRLYSDDSLSYYRVYAPVKSKEIGIDPRANKRVLAAAAGFAGGAGAVLLPFMGMMLIDGRLRTVGDLHRATGLPILHASLPGDKRDADQTLQEWTRLKPKLQSPSGAVVCGFLAQGSQAGLTSIMMEFALSAERLSSAVIVIADVDDPNIPSMPLADAMHPELLNHATAWMQNDHGIRLLSTGDRWTWSSEQRQALDLALTQWARVPNAVVLVALPDATRPEALLMASPMPRVLWVGTGDESKVSDIAERITTYRHAGCQFQGALMHQSVKLKPAVLNKVARMITAFVLLAALPIVAQDDSEAIARHGAERVALAKQRLASMTSKPAAPAEALPAPEFRLGPGDGVSIGIFGMPELERPAVSVAPDGTITYLHVHGLQAAGLTIDELRDALADRLRSHYQTPRLIITPIAFKSQRVYVLGKVVKKGVIMMDRPLTVLEAVTEAGGLETGLFQQNTVELADLGRSFLVRGQKRLNVDFEALFYRGDMNQNLPLEPEDYLYFPSANNNEIYVIGSVMKQGMQGLLTHSTVVSAVTMAGGFAPYAYRSRVLVVRGSLDKPQTFEIDMDRILRGTELNFRLEPKDIIYVASHPWKDAAELLEAAIGTFMKTAILSAASSAVPALITTPLITTEKDNGTP